MKRTNEVHTIIHSVVKRAYLMSLATTDESGPWVSDVIFVSDQEFNFYWISDINRRHSKAIEKHNKVAATITLTQGPNEDDIGLQIEGWAKKLDGDHLERATLHRLKRKKSAPKKGGEILDQNESWYRLKPTKIELIYSPKWGFRKQIIKLN